MQKEELTTHAQAQTADIEKRVNNPSIATNIPNADREANNLDINTNLANKNR